MIRVGDVCWYLGDPDFAPKGFDPSRPVTVRRVYGDEGESAAVDYFHGESRVLSHTSFDVLSLSHYPPELFKGTIPPPGSGRFVVFEGLDGAGKTTLIHHVEQLLVADDSSPPPSNFTVKRTVEPLATYLRRALRPPPSLDGQPLYERPTPTELARLFALDRHHHALAICNGLHAGEWILCDRYYYSTLAYQGAQGVSMDVLLDGLAHLPRPHLTVFLDTPPDLAMARDQDKATAIARERSAEIRDRYRELWRFLSPGDLLVLDGLAPARSNAEAVVERLRHLDAPVPMAPKGPAARLAAWLRSDAGVGVLGAFLKCRPDATGPNVATLKLDPVVTVDGVQSVEWSWASHDGPWSSPVLSARYRAPDGAAEATVRYAEVFPDLRARLPADTSGFLRTLLDALAARVRPC